jgi:hypothetical protein
MYLYSTKILDNDLEVSKAFWIFRKTDNPPETLLDQFREADRLEVWASSFKDEGEDFCEFRLIKDDKTVLTQRANGY